MAPPHHRHQASLEGVLDFSTPTSLEDPVRDQATRLFGQIIDYYEPTQKTDPYLRVTLLRAIFDYTPSKDIFLTYLFQYIDDAIEKRAAEPSFSQILSRIAQFESMTDTERDKIGQAMTTFAELIFENLLLPLKAAGAKTPQPSPIQFWSQDAQISAETPSRISSLRAKCLERDRHRCVVSRRFDKPEALRRFKRHGRRDAKDDDGRLLREEIEGFDYLEVAHIFPHSLTSSTSEVLRAESKRTALGILNMFDHGVANLIGGLEIDRPFNAITLTPSLHRDFGNFDMYFEPTQNQTNSPPHTYTIDTLEVPEVRDRMFPITRSLYLTPTHTIDPPSPRLLTLHRAIAYVLHLSGAGDYISEILRAIETRDCKEDGSSELGRIVSLKLHGWLDDISVH